MSDGIELLERAVTRYGYQPSNYVISEAREWIEKHRHTKCEVCNEPIDLEGPTSKYYSSRLMGDPAPLVCNHCFKLWYECGMTDPDKMRAERAKQRQQSEGGTR